jgi:hypothetical protein
MTATETYEFDSKCSIVGAFPCGWGEETVKNEPMLFSADRQFAHKHGGALTHAFLEGLPPAWRCVDAIIDSRVHMLMPGWYPCIPGFHHDDVDRSALNNQPNYENPAFRTEHLVGSVNSEICPTLFALGRHRLPKPKPAELVYKKWHPVVEKQLARGELNSYALESGKYVAFDDRTMHAGTRAVKKGWRWWIRMTSGRTKRVESQVRRQVQVYLDPVNEGW